MMELDGNELEDYLNNHDNAAAVAAAAAAAFTMPPPLSNSLNNGTQSMMTTGDLEAMVENVHELRRRSIVATFGTGVSTDYLDMAAASEASAYNSMVSPSSMVSGDTYSLSPSVSQMGLSGAVNFSSVNTSQAEMNMGLIDTSDTGEDSITQPLAMFNAMQHISTTEQMMMPTSLSNSVSNGQMHQFVPTSTMLAGLYYLFPYVQTLGSAEKQIGMVSEYAPVEPTIKTDSRYNGVYSSSGFDMLEILVSNCLIRPLNYLLIHILV